MARSEGQTLLEVLCSHYALSPRAPQSVVQLVQWVPWGLTALWRGFALFWCSWYSGFREGLPHSGKEQMGSLHCRVRRPHCNFRQDFTTARRAAFGKLVRRR